MSSRGLTVGVLLSRVRVEEKLLLQELSSRGVETKVIDDRSLVLATEHRPDLGVDVVLERCIQHGTALYALSILDGWWAEAYDGLNGFAIGVGRTHSNQDFHDARDGLDLYRVLQEEVIPLYYQRDVDGLPREWIKRMKRTIRTLGWRFNADRMVMDYVLKCYIPAAGGTRSPRRSPRKRCGRSRGR